MKQKVQVWIYARSTKSFLLLQTTPARGSFWQPVTGSVEDGEDSIQAAVREVQEETGFSGTPKDVGYSFQFESKWGSTEETCFLLVIEEEKRPILDSKEHTSFQWLSGQGAKIKIGHESNRVVLEKVTLLLNGDD